MSTLVISATLKGKKLAISPADIKGNPAPVDGVPKWSSSDDTIITIVPAEDGLSAILLTTGKTGNCQVSVLADADMGEGVVEIVGTLEVEVIAGQAVSLGITVSDLEEEPA